MLTVATPLGSVRLPQGIDRWPASGHRSRQHRLDLDGARRLRGDHVPDADDTDERFLIEYRHVPDVVPVEYRYHDLDVVARAAREDRPGHQASNRLLQDGRA